MLVQLKSQRYELREHLSQGDLPPNMYATKTQASHCSHFECSIELEWVPCVLCIRLFLHLEGFRRDAQLCTIVTIAEAVYLNYATLPVLPDGF